MRNCPICAAETVNRFYTEPSEEYSECPNGCYKYSYAGGNGGYFIFEKGFHEDQIEEISSEINFWKENDRYLLKLLESRGD